MSFRESKLTGAEWQELASALRSAFPSIPSLRMMVQYGLSENIDEFIANSAATKEATYELVRWAQSEGRVLELINAARNSNPGNPDLRAVAEAATLAPHSEALESVAAPGIVLVGVEEWRTKMSLSELCVCRVEIAGDPNGTGFLVGRDLVLTNQHVVQEVLGGARKPESVVCRFDYKVASDGVTLNPGVEYRLLADWLVDSSPVTELDYAMLRLKDAAGDHTVNNQTGAATRRWLRIVSHDFAIGERLFVIQHPLASPMKLGTGTVEEIASDGIKICHGADTDRGSSGSPCFTMRWDLVALHQHGKGYSEHCAKNGAINLGAVFLQPKVKKALTASAQQP
jgi:V8-like Glu-specific endopeptidase